MPEAEFPAAERLRRRALTLRAMGWLCLARLLVSVVAFGRWRATLGYGGNMKPDAVGNADTTQTLKLARLQAVHVERAAWRLPFEFKCLPRSMALSWMLKRLAVPHSVVIAARPMADRASDDALHAWVEVCGEIVIGDLPGPWHEIYRAGRPADS